MNTNYTRMDTNEHELRHELTRIKPRIDTNEFMGVLIRVYSCVIRVNSCLKKGFTLLEILVVILTVSIVIVAVGNIYILGLKVWSQSYSHLDVRSELTQAMEAVSKNLRQATSIDSLSESSITFTADLGSGSTSCRIYLYNASDPEPNPPYTQTTYALRWAEGSVSYGAGANLASDIVQPTSAPFTRGNNLITINLTDAKQDESVNLKSNVRPRNL